MNAVVVGGGIAGLAAARELASSGFSQVTVLEAGRRWGGKIASAVLDGVRLDVGAESLLARRPEAVELIGELGLGGQLVHPTDAKSQVLIDGSVRSLPPSAMGVPQDLDQLDGFLSANGLRRARREPELPSPALSTDVGIGAFVDRRFGPEVTDRLLEPLLGGVYAGQARNLSFDAVAPALFERARTGGSLLEHARQIAATSPYGPVFAGLQGGISTLVDALLADLSRRGVTPRTRAAVRQLVRLPGGGFQLVCGAVPAPETIDADAVVLATPAGPTGRLLSPLTSVGAKFADIPYASMAVITLVVDGAVLTGSGLLVPPGELRSIKAFTYSSLKWDWVGQRAKQAWGPAASVVRASVGRLGEARLLQVRDAELVRRTFVEASPLPGWAGAQLVTGHVQRWGGALPQYLVGHRDLVSDLRDAVSDVPGLAVCGAALDGVGIAACLASASAAVAKVNEDLGLAAIDRRSDADQPATDAIERNLT